jgi:hypothetical protein
MKSLKQRDSDTSGCLIVSRMAAKRFAAMPQHTAERLCLSGEALINYRGYPSKLGGVARTIIESRQRYAGGLPPCCGGGATPARGSIDGLA